MRHVHRLIVIASLVAASDACAEPATLQALLDAQGKACFARVYDAAHLRAHSGQKMERLFIAVSRDKPSAYWEIASAALSEINPRKGAAQQDADDPTHRVVQISGYATLRGLSKPENFSGWCYPDSSPRAQGTLSCGAECDRHLGALLLKDGAHVGFDGVDRMLFLDPTEEESPARMAANEKALGPDDRSFRLEARPLDECLAEAARTKPVWATLGAPLRERLKPDAPFCYGRDYGTTHLASHPRQQTTSIRITRDHQIITFDQGKGRLADWPDGARLAISVTTRQAPTPVTLRYACAPEDSQWVCAAEDEDHVKTTGCAQRSVYLRRGPGGAMMLGNPGGGLPLGGACGREAKTTSDDRSYRLEALPLEACAGR